MSLWNRPYLNSKLDGFGTTIFAEVTAEAIRHRALNLGQGFPDFDGPEVVKRAAIEAIAGGRNQYARTSGTPELCAAVSRHQQRFYDLEYDPEDEITVYSGATEAIASVMLALFQQGDEIVCFEPFYDSYRATIALSGAVDRLVTLRSPEFAIDFAQLERRISANTRALLLNSPHNPTGKVFDRTELEHLAAICRRHDLIVISDEVYEHLVFDGEHIPMASLPGMKERTVTISSTGKTFSLTGWKIGYTCASPELTKAMRTAHQFLTFCSATPFQQAMSVALDLPSSFYRQLRAEYQQRRDLLCSGLQRIGFDVLVPSGTYFALADIRPLGYDDDVEFCRLLPRSVGVAAIPPSAFYVDKAAGRHLVRFAFCKKIEVLEEAVRRLERLSPGMNRSKRGD